MDQEVAKLIDTTLKIGLGALIGAVAAYIQRKVAHSHDKERAAFDRTTELIERIAIKIEFAQAQLRESTHRFWVIVPTSDPARVREASKESIGDLLRVQATIGEAKALAYVLGQTELARDLEASRRKTEELYQEFSNGLSNDRVADMNDALSAIEDSLNGCFKFLTRAYHDA